ncbi:MAG: hypothetical protein HY556_07690 [Euryarchaeota archaeon]|nr:hypothetical protein [Euryarchaeota archaeon]
MRINALRAQKDSGREARLPLATYSPIGNTPYARESLDGVRGLLWICLLVALLLGVSLTMADEARADSATNMSGALPTARDATSAVWDGTNAYIFGGYDGNYLDKIVRYNPSTDTITNMTATLPTQVAYASAVWDGTNAYIFGGSDPFSRSNTIVRYHPGTDTVTTMTATLPTARVWTSAAWDGTNAYIFGGYDGAVLDQIVRYSPATDTVTVMNGTLPSGGGYLTSAVWGGTKAYLFGGCYTQDCLSNKVLRYDPGTDTVNTLTATLTTGRYATSAAWDGTNAYIFGGFYNNVLINEIVGYNPGTDTVTTMTARLPTGRDYTSAVWDGTNSYVFGGYDGGRLNKIVRYGLGPGAPQTLAAYAGPASGEITLTWQPPLNNTYSSSITNYTVYRGSASGSLSLFATIGNVTTYVDTGLPLGATRYYRITASTASGESPRSNEASATTYNLPSEPIDVTAFAGPEAGTVQVAWQHPLDDGGCARESMQIKWGGASGDLPNLETFPPYILGWKAMGVGANVTRYYQVRAANCVGPSPFSPEVSATSFSTPSAPENFVSEGSRNAINLSWQPPAGDGGMNITHYRLYGRVSAGPWTFIKNVSAAATNAADIGLPENHTRSHRLTAVNLVGEGEASNEATATTFAAPSVPQGLAASGGPAPGEITISWSPPSSDGGAPVLHYNLMFGDDQSASQGGFFLGNVTSFTHTGLGNHETVYYRMTAENAAGEGQPTGVVSATSLGYPGAPVNLTAVSGPEAGQISLGWEAPGDNGGTNFTGYRLYRMATSSEFPGALAAELGSSAFSYVDDTGGVSGTEWFYAVATMNVVGEGNRSEQAANFTPRGDTVTPREAALPDGLGDTASVWTGEDAYIFGGRNGTACTAEILRYDDALDEFEHVADLVEPLCSVSALWSGDYVYLFGGFNGSGYPGDILRFDPAMNSVTDIGDLTKNICCKAAGWADGKGYLFGDYNASTQSYDILRFDPATNGVTDIGDLSRNICCAAAASVGPSIYLFGARNDSDNKGEILRFDPSTGTVEKIGELTDNICCAAAAYSGQYVYLFGGEDNGSNSQNVWRFDPSNGTLELSEATLPEPACCASAVWTGEHVLIFGGSDDDGEKDAVLQYNVAPHDPQDISAAPGPGANDISVTWREPAYNGSAVPGEYRVYRAEGDGEPRLLARLGDTRSHVDSTCPAGTTCHYTVTAVSSGGESANSGRASQTGLVLNPKIAENGDGSMTAYNDANDNGSVDDGEGLISTPSVGALLPALPVVLGRRFKGRGRGGQSGL